MGATFVLIYKGGGVPTDSSKTETKPDGTTVEKEVDGAVFIYDTVDAFLCVANMIYLCAERNHEMRKK